MLMQEKERVTEGKTGILDPVIPGQTDMKKERRRERNDGEAKEQR